jgi:hypothetical protein
VSPDCRRSSRADPTPPTHALFGLYALIYGFSQITAGIQLRQLPADVDSLSELHDAAT